ncbi:MAG TPA: hypothetical protein DEF72_03645 [Gammaproteobacteria bacterium]|nr:hypothetical protein [Gammaproteobacteria bacterium]HBX26507.1 hypothetical protein [Gammaproteobacteria bacterium]
MSTESWMLIAFLLVAHLIIFSLSQDSNVTPPVCLAAFTAARIAKSPPLASGFQAWRSAKGLYIVPLLFAYTPLLTGSIDEMLRLGLFSLYGIYAVNAMISRFAEGPLAMWHWPLLTGGGVLCFMPLDWLMNLAGAFSISLVIFSTNKQNQFFNPSSIP